MSTIAKASGPPATPRTRFGQALSGLTAWLSYGRAPGREDARIRPRHWRWAACRIAMRLAVVSLLAARRHVPDPGDRWAAWKAALSRMGRSDSLFHPAQADSPRPELRALAGLEAVWRQGPDPELACPRVENPTGIRPAAYLGALYQELQESSRAQRKRSGSFYTGSALAGPTVERTLRPLVRRAGREAIGKLRICDPAMGTGAFLIAALDCLSDELQGRINRCELATSVLCGVDLDPTAVDLARWALWMEVDDPGLPIARLTNLRAGNSLLGCTIGGGTDPTVAEPPGVEGRRAFHWPLEFAEVFAAGGFDAVVGNPPWETLQPSSKEFFCELDEGYGELGTQQALRRQRDCHARDPGSEPDWQGLRGEARGFSRYARRRFFHQGSGKLYTYRLFLELAHDLLREGGRLGMIVPSGLYTDLGSSSLRELFLERCRWEWLFCFENRNGLFDIDSRYRFGPIVVQKGGRTRRIKTSFLRTDPGEWQRSSPPAFAYSIEQIRRLSPRHGALLDVRSCRDLEILDKIHRCGRPFLAEAGGDMYFSQGDFNMTSDSARFLDRRSCEAAGYLRDRYGRWVRGGNVALPLYQGAMLYDLHPGAAVHDGGAGHRTRWRRTGPESVRLGPQYLVDAAAYRALPPAARSPQLVLRALSNATNERTVVPSVINDLPCGNSLVILRPRYPDLLRTLFGAGVMASLVYDWSMRQRMAGTNLNGFILSESVWPEASRELALQIAVLAARLALITPRDAPVWLALRERGFLPEGAGWTGLLAFTRPARLRLQCMLDALAASAFGLDQRDLEWMLRDCDHPVQKLRDRSFRRTLDPKGFWRVDRDLEPRGRRTVLALGAFSALGEQGVDACCDKSPAELLAWQDCMSPGESWRLCARHAGAMAR